MMTTFEAMPTKRERIMFLADKETRDQLQAMADEDGRSLSNLVERLVLAALKTKPGSDSSSSDDIETLQLLIQFLSYLIEHYDHDGFSLSEISQILGQPDDRKLVTMVQTLRAARKGKGQSAKLEMRKDATSAD